MKTTDMTLADAIRAGLGFDVEDDPKKQRARVRALLYPPLVVFLPAKEGGRARIQGRSDSREWDMRYVRVQIGTVHDRDGIEIIPRFALCAFEDGGIGRELSPLEALDHIDPMELRDRLKESMARMGNMDMIRV